MNDGGGCGRYRGNCRDCAGRIITAGDCASPRSGGKTKWKTGLKRRKKRPKKNRRRSYWEYFMECRGSVRWSRYWAVVNMERSGRNGCIAWRMTCRCQSGGARRKPKIYLERDLKISRAVLRRGEVSGFV